jgi:hypothetical protein
VLRAEPMRHSDMVPFIMEALSPNVGMMPSDVYWEVKRRNHTPYTKGSVSACLRNLAKSGSIRREACFYYRK